MEGARGGARGGGGGYQGAIKASGAPKPPSCSGAWQSHTDFPSKKILSHAPVSILYLVP